MPRDRADIAPRTKRGRLLLDDLAGIVGLNQWTDWRKEQIERSIAAIEREAAAPDAPAPQAIDVEREAVNMLRRIVAARAEAWLDDEIEGAKYWLSRLS